MKFANIDADSFGFHKTEQSGGYLNFGDHIQVLAIDNLYQYMGIPSDQIVRLSYYDLQTYSGETLVLPINAVVNFMPLPSGELFSPDIIPVFLGMCLTNELPAQTLETIKKWSPIGCRDESTYRYLQDHGIDSYLAGCLTVSLPYRETCSGTKTFLLDAPKEVLPFIPEQYKGDVVTRSNVHVGKFDTAKTSPTQHVKELYRQLAEEAAIVVTSRLHVAAPCVGMGIPVVACLNRMLPSFSWIEKYIPLYLKADYQNNIDWKPCVPAKDKELILKTASGRVFEAYYRNCNSENCGKIGRHYLTRTALKYRPFSTHMQEFVKELLHRRSTDQVFKYTLWGVTPWAQTVYNEIQKQCPQAKLIAVYDTYKTGMFLNKEICSPTKIKATEDDIVYIVCALGAKDYALKLLQRLGVNHENVFVLLDELEKICGRATETPEGN